ncbi:MAG: O-antigen ligase family protein [Thermoleophilaceae bacterium]|nr:O-antigen ligase family protein [Thermoleophilaceae bacterium]
MPPGLLEVCSAVLVAGSTALAFFSGGFFDPPRLAAGVVACALVVVTALFAPRPLPTSTPGRVALLGLSLLTAWTALSLTWAPLGDRAQDDLQRLVLYLSFFVVALTALRGRRTPRWLEPALALGALVVVGYGLSERLLPELVELDRSRSAAGRLEQPLTYWNAFGLVAALGLVLCARLAGDARRGRGLRAAAAAAGVPLGLGVYLTFARGALAAVVLGLLVLVALAPAGRAQLRGVLAIVAPATAAALVASALPSVKSLEIGERGDPGDGVLMLVVTVLLSAAAAAIAWTRPRRPLRAPSLGVSRPRAVLGVAALVLVAGGVAVTLLQGAPEGTSPVRGASPQRLGSIDTNRYRYWEAAGETFADHPVVGIGSGGFAVEWLKVRDRVDISGDAHSIYLETAAELGVVGLAFLLLFVGGIGAAVFRLYRLDPAAGAGLAAALAAWAFHAGLDWDWEMPAATLPALLLGAAAVAWSEEPTGVAEDRHRAAEAPAIARAASDRGPAPERAV